MAYEVIERDAIQHIGVAASRPVNNIPNNGVVEYLLDDDGYIRVFCSVDAAKDFLRGYYGDEYVETLRYRYATVCPHCDAGVLVDVEDVSKDDLGICYTCPKCGKSFDVI